MNQGITQSTPSLRTESEGNFGPVDSDCRLVEATVIPPQLEEITVPVGIL